MELDITVENIVASTVIKTENELDLGEMSSKLPEARYDSDDFPGLIYRIENPDLSILFFESKKLVCTGARNIEDIDKAINSFIEKLKEIGIKIDEKPEIKVENIVASTDLGSSLNLNALAVGIGLEKVEYEPEEFPGLIYRLDNPPVALLLFSSGKTIITGASEETQIRKGAEKVIKELQDLELL